MGLGQGMVSLHGVEVSRALGCTAFQGEVPLDGSAVFLFPGDPPELSGPFGAQGPPWSVHCDLNLITQGSGQAWWLVCPLRKLPRTPAGTAGASAADR